MKFNEYVESRAPAFPILPIFHSLRTRSFEEVLLSGILKRQKCPFFHEKILYLFYGKPAYRINVRPDRVNYIPYQPIALMFDLSESDNIRRIFPFDTGGFHLGLYSGHLDNDARLEDFELNSDASIAARAVAAFFGKNSDYYEGSSVVEADFHSIGHEVQCYASLMRLGYDTDPDDRRCTLEIQLENDLQLSSRLLAVALPRNIVRRDSVLQFFSQNPDIDLLTYPSTEVLSVDSCHERVTQAFWHYLGSAGRL